MGPDPVRRTFTLAADGGGAALEVIPYVVITFVSPTEVRPYVVFKTKPGVGWAVQPAKTIKYFCCEGAALPLSGAGGRLENGGEPLRTLLTAELDTAIRVMLRDRTGRYPRADVPRVQIEGSLPFIGKSFKVRGNDLGRFGSYRLLELPGGAMVFGGVQIAEPSALDVQALPPK